MTDEAIYIPENCDKIIILRRWFGFRQRYHFKFLLPDNTSDETVIAAESQEQIDAIRKQLSGWKLVEQYDSFVVYERNESR